MEITDPLYMNSLENLVKGISEAARTGWMEVDDAERLTRVLMSQGNDRFADYFVTENFGALREPEVAAAIASKLANPIAKATQGLNYSYGTEGHHGISVSSIESASRHLPFQERMKFLQALKDNYTYSGTDPEDMFPLTTIGHQQKGTARGTDPYNAHFDANPSKLVEGFTPNQGTWQSEDFTAITDPEELAHEFWRRSGEPQIMAAETAFDQPGDVAFRQDKAAKLGIRERDLYLSGTKNGKPIAAANKQALGNLGIKNEVLKQNMQESFGQTYRPPDPNRPKTPYVGRPPKPFSGSKVLNPPAPAQIAKSAAQGAPTPPVRAFGNRLMRGGAAALGIVPIAGNVLDAGDVYAGTVQAADAKQSAPTRVAGGLRGAAGALGIASTVAPPLAPAALAIGGVSALADRRAEQLRIQQGNRRTGNYGPAVTETPRLTITKPPANTSTVSRTRSRGSARGTNVMAVPVGTQRNRRGRR